ncbi:hypothetical protein DFH28DRAFT_399142 [Melampsora americana]|nr:hypothetical protein DFH28DRAFT_399142 [Melampsora americana]
MKRSNLAKSLGCATLAILGLFICFAQIEQITCVQVGRFTRAKRMTEEVEAVKDSEAIEEDLDPVWNHPLITENVLFQDEDTKSILNHVKTSPFAKHMKMYQDIKKMSAASEKNGLEHIIQELETLLKETSEEESLKNISNLKLWEEFIDDYTNASPEEISKVASNIVERARDDHAKAMKVATRYQQAIEAGNYAVILDNEGDDLLYLWVNFHDRLIPKVIITYGGFVKLRFQAVKKFVTALCERYDVKEEDRPKVYQGFPHPYPPEQKRHSYDPEEGVGYIDEGLRDQYIDESLALENDMKDEEGKWKPKAWDRSEFEEGLTALETLITNSDYTAIAVLTCPATVAHLISKNQDLGKKIGVTMASPWFWSTNDKGVYYRPTFNGERQIPVMNQLLKSGVDFIGVGGGTARTKGMRTIHDAKYGAESSEKKYYGEKGLENLEKVLSTGSDVEFLRIIAHAGQNIMRPTWRSWDKAMSKLWEYLKIKPIDRPNLASLREVSERITKLRGGIEKDKPADKVPGPVSWWGLDTFLSWSKIWLIWLNPVQWQAPSADLHALITTKAEYLDAISGVACYAAGDAEKGKLVKFAKPENEDEENTKDVFYSISDMNFQVLIDGLQKMLNEAKPKEIESTTEKDHLPVDSTAILENSDPLKPEKLNG